MVHDTVRQLEAGVLPTHIKLDTNIGHLHEHSVRWLVEAYPTINKNTRSGYAYRNIYFLFFNI